MTAELEEMANAVSAFREELRSADLTPAQRAKMRRGFIREELRKLHRVVSPKAQAELDRVMVVHADQQESDNVTIQFVEWGGVELVINGETRGVEPTFAAGVKRTAVLVYESMLSKAWGGAFAEWDSSRAFTVSSPLAKVTAEVMGKPSRKTGLVQPFAPGGELVSVKIKSPAGHQAELELLSPDIMGHSPDGDELWSQLARHIGPRTLRTFFAAIAEATDNGKRQDNGMVTFSYSPTKFGRLLGYPLKKNGETVRIADKHRDQIDADMKTLEHTTVTAEFNVRGKKVLLTNAPLLHREFDVEIGKRGRRLATAYRFGELFQKLWQSGAMMMPVPFALIRKPSGEHQGPWNEAVRCYLWLGHSARIYRNKKHKRNWNKLDTLASRLHPAMDIASARAAVRRSLKLLAKHGIMATDVKGAGSLAKVHFEAPDWPWFARSDKPKLPGDSAE